MVHDDMFIRKASLTNDRGCGALLTNRFGKRLWQAFVWNGRPPWLT
jgi:hypothetical protein